MVWAKCSVCGVTWTPKYITSADEATVILECPNGCNNVDSTFYVDDLVLRHLEDTATFKSS